MSDFRQPLAVYFVWHPSDEQEVKPLVHYCFERYQRNTNKPFSRNMNLPVFFRTSSNNEIPIEINSTAEKTIIFCFSSANITGRKIWRDYYDTFQSMGSHHVIPVAINSGGFNLNKQLASLNFIRLTDFDNRYKCTSFFISATHEIIRFAFMAGGTTSGNKSALKLFLSHTKYDDWAVETAIALKKFIDETSMHRFFDVYDIHAGHNFGDEIEDGTNDATLIAVQSDSYSTRYWCQKEIQFAKDKNKPMIVVNHLQDNEDRIFPHSVNVPSIRIISDCAISDTDKYKVIAGALLETLRQYYHAQLLKNYETSSALLLTRPPELTDIPLLLSESGGNIKRNVDTILYPEPPVYNNELKFLEPLGIEAVTPLTSNSHSLEKLSVGISISDPDKEEVLKIGHNENHLIGLSQTIARHLLFRNATLVYGGDLRPNGFTDYLCEEAKIVQDLLQHQDTTPLLRNYSAWPIYKSIDESALEWNSKNHKVMEMIEVDPTLKVEDKNDIKTFLPPINPENSFTWALCLTKMRNEMINDCDYRITAGGRLFGYKGKYPGVFEEIFIAIQEKKPLYLIGGFGGITSKVCKLLVTGNIPEELSLEWQQNHTSGYKKIVELFEQDPDESNIDYSAIIDEISNLGICELSKNNGLTEDQNKRLFESEFIDEIVLLILEGIKNVNKGRA